MMKNFYRILILLLINTSPGYSQVTSTQSISFPTVVPPSPDAQAFMRYGEYPVDYSTGVPKIDIPLYEIKSGQLSLPISISYHASGIRVNDVSSVAGLGWKLNAGGVFTRTVKGKADEISGGFLSQAYLTKSDIDNAPLSSTVYYQLESMSRGEIDAASDNYYYSTGDGLSQQFVYDNSNNIVPLSYTTDKIIKHPVTNAFGAKYYLEVIKDDGTSYIFDQYELTLYDGEWYPSSWWLSKIIAANKIDFISFEYEKSLNPYADYQVSQSWTYGVNSANTGQMFSTSYTTSNTYPLLLKKINFNNGYMQFDYNNDRLDVRESRLTAVSVYNNGSSLPLKKYQLVQSYFNSGFANTNFNRRLKLDRLDVFDGNGGSMNNYTFNYDENNILPPYFNPHDNNPNACYAVDFWGYYNGQVQNPSWVPYLPANNVSANRTPNETYAKACILNKISYPTGGFTSFEYNSNVKHDGDIGGGLRIHKIISKTDINSTAVTKRYEYANNLLGQDRVPDAEGMYNYTQSIINIGGNCSMWTNSSTIYMDNPVISLSNHNGSPALYQFVDEFTHGTANNNLKTEYIYLSQPDIIYGVNSPRYQNEYFIDRSWRRGQLGNTSFYKLVNGTYSRIKSIDNNYDDFATNTIITGTKVQQIVCTPQTSGCFIDMYTSNTPFNHYFFYFDETIEVGIKKLIGETVSEYDDNGNVVTTNKTFNYNSPNHLYPTSSTFTDSKNNSIITQLKYPHDFSGTTVYNSMIAKNIISPVVEQQYYNGANFLSSLKTNYKDWGNNIIASETVEAKKLNSSPEIRLRFNTYDIHGNVLSGSKENDATEAYFYGYNYAYPVAKIVGKSYTDALSQSGIDLAVLNNPLTTDAAMRTELNKLRQLSNCLVSTYTYKPLVGVSSETDPNGKTTYYEYDAYNRLTVIRDKDNNILKKICYNYTGQPENCLTCTDFTPNWQNTSTTLRCQESSQPGNCGNTGYQEQEQKDMNPCSPTYNTTKWILAGYNPTACALPSCVSLTSTNTVGEAGYVATYYNLSSGKTYNFTVSSASGSQTLGSIPAGSYDLTIAKPGTTMSRIFKSGCKFQTITGSTATFYNISVASNTCNSISIAPNLEN